MIYILDLTTIGGENKSVNQIGRKLCFDGVEIPHLFAEGRLDIRQFYIDGNLIIKYEKGDVEISVDEEKKGVMPTRSTLLISRSRISGVEGMKEIKGDYVNLSDANLADLSLFLPLGGAKGFHFALIFATEFDFGDKDGKYHVNVPCMQYTEVK